MTTVKHRETHFVMAQLDGTGKFNANLDINETTDEIRIVQVMYVPDTQNAGFGETGLAATGDAAKFLSGDSLFRLGWDGLSSCLFLFDVGHAHSNVNIRINAHRKNLRGKHTFTISDYLGQVDKYLHGRLGFVFESVTY